MCVSERYFGKMTNPYTLNHLYSQGILDYVPYDLCGGAVVSPMNGMQNPYINAAQQGALYQNHGMYGDTVELGLGNNNIGTQGVGILGRNDIGSQSQAGENKFGLSGIGAKSQAGGAQSWGGFGDVQNDASKAAAAFESIPNFVKGIAAGVLMVGSLAFVLKRGKKPVQVQKQGFFSKLNPFKKK